MQALEELVELLEQDALDLVQDEGPDGDAPGVAHPAEDDHRQDGERDVETRTGLGLTMPSFEALKTPANPAVEAPSAKARSFVVTVFTPALAAASSSSRIAIQARPSLEPWSR